MRPRGKGLMESRPSLRDEAVTISFFRNSVVFILKDGSHMRVPARAVQQSRLLQEVRDEFDGQHGESGFVAAVPQRVAVAWLQYARCRERRVLLEDMLERNEMALVDLLVGADMLIDEQTTQQVCAALGYLLLPHDGVRRIPTPSSPDFSDLSSPQHWIGGWNEILSDPEMHEDTASVEGTTRLLSSARVHSSTHGPLAAEPGSMGVAALGAVSHSTDAQMLVASDCEQGDLEGCGLTHVQCREGSSWASGHHMDATADTAASPRIMSQSASHSCALATGTDASGPLTAPEAGLGVGHDKALHKLSKTDTKASSWDFIPDFLRDASSYTQASELSGTSGSWAQRDAKGDSQSAFDQRRPLPVLSPAAGTTKVVHKASHSAPGFLRIMEVPPWAPGGLTPEETARACQLVRILDALSEDLGIAVLRTSTASLAGLLCCLPPKYHPLALRAHCPSIDARCALRIQRVNSATALLAVSAASLLPQPLRALRFHARGISQHSLEHAMGDIGRLTALTSLDISGLCMGAAGIGMLAPHLCRLALLRSLSLGENDIVAQGARALAPCFAHLPHLETLELAWNDIGEDGARALAPQLPKLSRLMTLGMNGNQIGAAGAAAQAPMLPSLSQLQNLSLYYNAIGDAGARALSEHFCALTTLRILDLEGNGIGNEGAIALAPCMTAMGALEVLSFVHNRIGDEALGALSETFTALTSLKTLDLSSNCIGDEGAVYLAQCMPAMQSLQLLSLNFNRIGDAGADVLAQHLRHTSTVQTLLLRWNALGRDGLHLLQHPPDNISHRLGPAASGF